MHGRGCRQDTSFLSGKVVMETVLLVTIKANTLLGARHCAQSLKKTNSLHLHRSL